MAIQGFSNQKSNNVLVMDFNRKRPETRHSFYLKSGEIDNDGIVVIPTNVDMTGAHGVVVIYTPLGESITTALKVTNNEVSFQAVAESVGTYEFEVQITNTNGRIFTATNTYEVLASLRIDLEGSDIDIAHQMAAMMQLFESQELTRIENENGRVMAEELRSTKFDEWAVRFADMIRQMQDKIAWADRYIIENVNAMYTDVQAKIVEWENRVAAGESKITTAINTMNTNFTNLTNTLTKKVDDNVALNTKNTNDCIDAMNKAIAAGTVDGEVHLMRDSDYTGAHANAALRLDAFEDLATGIMGDGLEVSGYGEIQTEGTQEGIPTGTVISGNTMVNVGNLSTYKNTSRYSYNEQINTLTGTGSTSSWNTLPSLNNISTKLDGVYTFVFTFDTSTSTNEAHIMECDRTYNGLKIQVCDFKSSKGVKIVKYTAKIADSHFTIKLTGTISNLLILEGDHTDKPLEFFEGLKSAELSEVTSHGVNLVDINDFGVSDVGGGIYATSKYYTEAKLVEYRLKPNATYQLRFEQVDCVKTTFEINGTNGYVNSMSYRKNISLGSDGILKLRLGATSFNDIGSKFKELALYEVTPNTPTTYTPYQSSTTSLPSPVILRSLPNGVADTYDFDTQTLTRRCGEVVLNGSENWGSASSQSNDTTLAVTLSFNMQKLASALVCDKFQDTNVYPSSVISEGMYSMTSAQTFFVRILKSKLATPDVAGFKAWIAQNPTTVVYELATPTTEVYDNPLTKPAPSPDLTPTPYTAEVLPVEPYGPSVLLPDEDEGMVENNTTPEMTPEVGGEREAQGTLRPSGVIEQYDHMTYLSAPSIVPLHIKTKFTMGSHSMHGEQIRFLAKQLGMLAQTQDISGIEQAVKALRDGIISVNVKADTNQSNITILDGYVKGSNVEGAIRSNTGEIGNLKSGKFDASKITYGTSTPSDSDGKPDGTLYFKHS